MHRKGLSGIGVTETEGGPLIGNLSMSDLRGLTPDRQAVESGRGRGVLPAWLAALHEQFEWLCQHCAAASNGTTTRSPAPDARCTGNNPAFSLSLPCRFGALALPVGSFLLLQKGKGLRWEDCLTEQLPPAIKVGARPAIKAHDWVVWWPRHRRPCPVVPPCAGGAVGRGAQRHSIGDSQAQRHVPGNHHEPDRPQQAPVGLLQCAGPCWACFAASAKHAGHGSAATKLSIGCPVNHAPPIAVACRVYVVDEEGKAVGVVTPTDSLRLVSA